MTSKLEARENRRKSIVGSMVNSTETPTAEKGRGRPKEEGRELKKRISLSIRPSLYEDIQKIAYVQRRSVSSLIEDTMAEYRDKCAAELKEYEKLGEK